jgi:hypothetical protein
MFYRHFHSKFVRNSWQWLQSWDWTTILTSKIRTRSFWKRILYTKEFFKLDITEDLKKAPLNLLELTVVVQSLFLIPLGFGLNQACQAETDASSEKLIESENYLTKRSNKTQKKTPKICKDFIFLQQAINLNYKIWLKIDEQALNLNYKKLLKIDDE